MTNVYWACAFVLACIAFYKFAVPRLRSSTRKMSSASPSRRATRPTPTPISAMPWIVADQQVEEVQEVTVGDITHYLFEAQAFTTREEAEDMRARRVGVVARRFYEELPAALMARSEPRSNLSARERASARWKRTIH